MLPAQSRPIFISYAHADNEASDRKHRWLDRLREFLKPLVRQEELTICSDRDIKIGQDWHQHLQAHLKGAKAAVLLVSPAFLTPDYIANNELPVLLKNARDRGVQILPIILSPCLFEETRFKYPDPKQGPEEFTLASLQAGTLPSQTLIEMSEAEQNRVLLTLARRLLEIVKEHPPSVAPPLSSAPPVEGLTTPAYTPSPVSTRVAPSRLPATSEYWVGRDDELAALDRAWEEQRTNIVVIVAPGGMGKTALVQQWRQRLAQDWFRGETRVYDWSFYSQGVNDTEVSADAFFDETLRWFGEADPTTLRSPWQKGERLATLVTRQHTLLVLDGIEPMQYPPGAHEGRLKDQALQAFLRSLVEQNPGLCVITTREPIYELAYVVSPAIERIDLTQLSPAAGAELLRQMGVDGEPAELEAASQQYGGYALALVLLGTLLRDAYDGRVGALSYREQDRLHLFDGQESAAAHAGRVMRSYERWFERAGDQASLALWRLLGLFDRPAEWSLIQVLLQPPAIPGLTEPLTGLSELELRRVLQRLQRATLIAPTGFSSMGLYDRPFVIDAHQLVREHLTEWLRQHAAEAWHVAHNRLYEHLKVSTDQYPDTLAGLQPLYAAMAHGCHAGRHRDALHEVYWRRIQRRSEFFSTRKLGAFGDDLTAMSYLFTHIWDRPASGLSSADQAAVLNKAGLALRTLGRLSEAVGPVRAAFEARISLPDRENATTCARNLCELMLTLGDIQSAVLWGERSVSLADCCNNPFERMAVRATLADVLHQSGRESEAVVWFREAEMLQMARQPEYPRLYALWGFQYCNQLLAEAERTARYVPLPLPSIEGRYPRPVILPGGEGMSTLVQTCRAVREQATQTLQWAEHQDDFLAIALDHLTLARLGLIQLELDAIYHNPLKSLGLQSDMASHLEAAEHGLRQASIVEFVVGCLLTRAEWRAWLGDVLGTEADLREVEPIVTSSRMRLYLTDLHLLHTRLYIACNLAVARKHLAQAKALVADTGYHRRDAEIIAIAGAIIERHDSTPGVEATAMQRDF